MNAALVKETVPSRFDDVAGTYDLLTGANPGYHRHLRMSAQRMPLAPGARVLDLCCGTGSSTAGLRAAWPDAEILGVDASAGMLSVARTKPTLRATFVQGDASPGRAGLGLSSVRRVVAAVGGATQLESRDRGTRVVLQVPQLDRSL